MIEFQIMDAMMSYKESHWLEDRLGRVYVCIGIRSFSLIVRKHAPP